MVRFSAGFLYEEQLLSEIIRNFAGKDSVGSYRNDSAAQGRNPMLHVQENRLCVILTIKRYR